MRIVFATIFITLSACTDRVEVSRKILTNSEKECSDKEGIYSLEIATGFSRTVAVKCRDGSQKVMAF